MDLTRSTIETDVASTPSGGRGATLPAVVIAVVVTVLLAVGAQPSGAVVGPEQLPASAGVVIDFEDYPANISGSGAAPPITDRYRADGVIFPNGVTALRYDESSFPPRPDLPLSGSNVITSCYATEFCSNSIDVLFTESVAGARLHVGYGGALASPATLVVRAFDSNGTLVDETLVTLPAADEAIPVGLVAAVEASTAAIVGLEVEWADPDRFLSRLLVDDVSVTTVPPVAELTLDPAAVELEVVDGSVVAETLLVNTGTVELGAALLDPEGAAELRSLTGAVVEVLGDTKCLRLLAPGEACEIRVEVTPDPDNDVVNGATIRVPFRASGGATPPTLVVEVQVSPVVQQPSQPPSDPTTPSDDPASSESAAPTEAPTATEDDPVEPTATERPSAGASGSPGGGSESGPTIADTILGTLVLAGTLAAGGWALRRLVRRRRSTTPPPLPATRPVPPPPPPPVRMQTGGGASVQPDLPTLTIVEDLGTTTVAGRPDGDEPVLVGVVDRGTPTLVDHLDGTEHREITDEGAER